ncbi:MAG: hypothetical protein ABIE23_06055 [archaeon]
MPSTIETYYMTQIKRFSSGDALRRFINGEIDFLAKRFHDRSGGLISMESARGVARKIVKTRRRKNWTSASERSRIDNLLNQSKLMGSKKARAHRRKRKQLPAENTILRKYPRRFY